MTEWKPGDRALLPVKVDRVLATLHVHVATESDGVIATVDHADLIPDDRRPDWLPGQPGDVAEWSGKRWACRGESQPFWVRLDVYHSTADDDDIPADAVLVLPAKTRA